MIHTVAPALHLINGIDQNILGNAKTSERPVDTPCLTKPTSTLAKRSIFDNQQINVGIFASITSCQRTKKYNPHRINFLDDTFRYLTDNNIVNGCHDILAGTALSGKLMSDTCKTYVFMTLLTFQVKIWNAASNRQRL
ncbi:MAG: hypothetical protein A2079_00320 [Geobacteraceae bacterium GWC2_48_7]|nr:MAG: hypothetical protein A2079_00320 [Geobacteraceae bacterium GWC2_48_7]